MTKDAASAVAALARSFELMDVEGLKRAIEEASFLDETPGPDRQKLRAARTNLYHLKKRLAREEIANKAASEAAAAEAEELKKYNVADFDKLAESYGGLKWRMRQMPGGATMKMDVYYELYGLAQQAEHGDNTGEKPMWAEKGGLDFEGREKWAAWEGRKGMPRDEAKLKFLSLHDKFDRKAQLYG